MKYYEYLMTNKRKMIKDLEHVFTKNKVQPVGKGYCDCIVLKENLVSFIEEITSIGILIDTCGWWCYVNPSISKHSSCPHGMGGPKSIYYAGWFSELQNDFFSLDENELEAVLELYDKNMIYSSNMKALDGIINMLKKLFRYTPTDYIDGNKCVTPSPWLMVPEDWERIKL